MHSRFFGARPSEVDMSYATASKSALVRLISVAALVCCLSGSAWAFTISITVDENCNGLLTNSNGFSSALPCGFQNDPGPGGLPNVMTYSLLNPPGLTAGDVLLQE